MAQKSSPLIILQKKKQIGNPLYSYQESNIAGSGEREFKKNKQDALFWEEAQENIFEWPDCDMQELRFSFSSSSPNDVDMEVDQPWWVKEWSPEEHGEFQKESGASGKETCPSLLADEPDNYSEEFYHWNIDLEQKYHPLKSLHSQPQVKCEDRSMLIAWLSKVIRSYEYYQETLFLATNIIDRFLLLTPIALECFQLLGISSLFIAAKQLEVYHPSITELLQLSAGAYTKQHFLQMERIILKQLGFRFVVPTCLFFLEYYMHHIRSNKDVKDATMFKERPFRQMTRNLSELCIQDYSLCQYTPSVMALSAMAVVEEYANGRPADVSFEIHHLGPSASSVIKECSTEIWLYVSKVLDCPISQLAHDDFFENLPLQSR